MNWMHAFTQSLDGKLWQDDGGDNYDPYASGDYNNPDTGQYDPTLDPNNYDPNTGEYYGDPSGSGGSGGVGGFLKNFFGGNNSGGGGNPLGGGSSKAGNVAGQLSGAAAGLANQRSQQADLASLLAKSLQQQYENQLAQSLTKQVYAPQTGAGMAARGDVLSNVQPAKANFTPGRGYSFSGGLTPADFGPNARQAGQNLSNAGLQFQTNPQLPQTPNLTAGFPSTTPGNVENILSGAGATTGILNTLFGGNPNQSLLQSIFQQLQSQGGAQNPIGGGKANGPLSQAF